MRKIAAVAIAFVDLTATAASFSEKGPGIRTLPPELGVAGTGQRRPVARTIENGSPNCSGDAPFVSIETMHRHSYEVTVGNDSGETTRRRPRSTQIPLKRPAQSGLTDRVAWNTLPGFRVIESS